MKRTTLLIALSISCTAFSQTSAPAAGVASSCMFFDGLYCAGIDVCYDKAGNGYIGGVGMPTVGQVQTFVLCPTLGQFGNDYPSVNGNDELANIFTDPVGNVIAVGPSLGFGTDYDWCIRKIGRSGPPIWVTRYNGPKNGRDYLIGGGCDALGNIYVAGLTDGGYAPKASVAKYSPAGQLLWIKGFAYPDPLNFGTGYFTVTPAGTCYYATDGKNDKGNFGMFLQRYNSAGQLDYSSFYDTGAFQSSIASVCTDQSGNVYVAGQTATATAEKNILQLLKFDSKGGLTWSKPVVPQNDRITSADLKIDISGNLYTWCTDRLFSNGRGSGVLAKYSSSGSRLWRHTYSSLYSVTATKFGLDGHGYVYLGAEYRVGPLNDYFNASARLIKISPLGAIVWEVDCEKGVQCVPTATKVDANGDIHMSIQAFQELPNGYMGFYVKVAQAAILAGDHYTMKTGTVLTQLAPGVMQNDMYAKSGSAVLTNDAVNGSVKLSSDGGFTYTPHAGFSGTDTFQYQVTKALETSSTPMSSLHSATVTIDVNP